jgi:hypothetical protein
VMEEREPKMLRAFTAMEVDASGQLKTEQIQRAHAVSSEYLCVSVGQSYQVSCSTS